MRVVTAFLKRMMMLLAVLTGFAPVAARADPSQSQVRGNAATYAEGRGPAIWLIERGNTKIYLFGTVHIYRADLRWRTAALDRAIAEADELVLETVDSAGDATDGQRMLRPMQLGKSVSILSRVAPEARPALATAIGATGMPIEMFDNMTTWGAGFMLTSFLIRASFVEDDGRPAATSGAEDVLTGIFRKRRLPISGVETMMDQLNVFATMPLSAQRRFLESTVMPAPPAARDAAPSEDEAASTANAWVAGNVEQLAEGNNAYPPEIYTPLLTRRNANWVRWLEARLQRPGTVLFAVGAGHLAGPDSVQTMLAARGITARRIN